MDEEGRTAGVLQRLRADAMAAITELDRRIADITVARAGDNSDDEHDPEGATLAFERSQADALRVAAGRRLAEADAALARLGTGAHGICSVCGEPIPDARMEARPTTDRCVRHA